MASFTVHAKLDKKEASKLLQLLQDDYAPEQWEVTMMLDYYSGRCGKCINAENGWDYDDLLNSVGKLGTERYTVDQPPRLGDDLGAAIRGDMMICEVFCAPFEEYLLQLEDWVNAQ